MHSVTTDHFIIEACTFTIPVVELVGMWEYIPCQKICLDTKIDMKCYLCNHFGYSLHLDVLNGINNHFLLITLHALHAQKCVSHIWHKIGILCA